MKAKDQEEIQGKVAVGEIDNASKERNGKQNRRSGRGKGKGRGSKKFDPKGAISKIKGTKPHILFGKQEADNDYSWYNKIPELAKNAANLPFSQVNGLPIVPIKQLELVDGITPTYDATTPIMPGIFEVKLAPTIGRCQAPNDAANIAAQQLYTLDRKANSGATNYDKTDLMMLVVAMDSAYMLYEVLLRIYRALGSYNDSNRYLPDYLVNVLHASAELSLELANFRAMLNLFAYQLGSINVPDQFAYIKRHSWLFTNVYKDNENDKAQYYVYNPDGIYVWTEGQDSAPTSLVYTKMAKLNATGTVGSDRIIWRTLADIKSAINKVMTPLLGSEDVGTISGDLAKAFGDGGMIKISPVDEYQGIEPTYSKEVLTQISNSFTTGDWMVGDIVQVLTNTAAGPYLSQGITASSSLSGTANSTVYPLLNFIDNTIDSDNILVATRNMSMFTSGGASQTISDYCFGSEIVAGYTMWSLSYSSAGVNKLEPIDMPSNFIAFESEGLSGSGYSAWYQVGSFFPPMQGFLAFLNAYTKFDWAPAMYMWQVTSASGKVTGLEYTGTLLDINDYTPLTTAELRQIHDAAIMSLFKVDDYSLAVKH